MSFLEPEQQDMMAPPWDIWEKGETKVYTRPSLSKGAPVAL
jgi:hypothetical protein